MSYKPMRRLGLGVAALSAACVLAPVSSGVADAAATLNIQVEAGDPTMQNCYIKIFDKQNPGVTVSTTVVSAQAEEGANLTVLTSANPPDIGVVATNTAVYSRMLAAHDLYPLNAVWSADNLDAAYGANNAQSFKSGGVPYVVPVDKSNYNILFYNPGLLKKLGLPEPVNHRLTSFNQLATITEGLTKAGDYGIAMAGASGYEASWMIDTYLDTTATPAQYANYITSWQAGVPIKDKVTAAPFINALDAIQKMSKDNMFQAGYLGVTQASQAESLFLAQKAGFLLDGTWTVASVLNAKPGASFAYNWTLFPPALGVMKQNVVSNYAGDSMGIPKGAANKALAEKYLEIIGSPQGQLCDIQSGNVPAIITMPPKDLTALPATVQQILQFAKKNGSQTGWTSALPGNVGAAFTDPLVQELLAGKLTPVQLADKVQANLIAFKAGKS